MTASGLMGERWRLVEEMMVMEVRSGKVDDRVNVGIRIEKWEEMGRNGGTRTVWDWHEGHPPVTLQRSISRAQSGKLP